MMRLLILHVLALLSTQPTLMAQSFHVELTNGSSTQHTLTQVTSIGFRDGVLALHRTTGQVMDWDLSDVSRLRFHDLPTSVDKLPQVEWNAYPNADGGLVVDMELLSACPVRVELFDVVGRRLHTTSQSMLPPGLHRLRLPSASANGVFICRVAAGAFLSSRTIVSIMP